MKNMDRRSIENAIQTYNFARLYDAFDARYNYSPVFISPAEAFRKARKERLIDEQTYKAAERYYGQLWFYVGD